MSAVSRDNFPSDDDGEVLFRLAAEGVDLGQKREIEFYCYAKDEETAERIVLDLKSYGYNSSVFIANDGFAHRSVSVYSSITMLPSYELIVLEQKRLNLILFPYHTRCDGWVTASAALSE